MSTPWMVAVVLQMLVTGVLAVIVVSLVRQFGIVALRLNPSAGMDTEEGPGPGSELPAQPVPLLAGGIFQFAGERAQPLIAVFLSPDCTICNAVADHVLTLSRGYAHELDLLIVVHSTPRVAREYVRDHRFESIPVALKQNFPSNHGISTTPFALAITAEGTVAGRGVPNALEHLEELVARAKDDDPRQVVDAPLRVRVEHPVAVAHFNPGTTPEGSKT